MPTLTQLEYVVAVDKSRHFGRAAELCHITQPTLSAQIQKVEDELGFPLFDRLKKPVVPTDRGARLIAQARVILREHRRLLDLSRAEVGEVTGELRVGVIPTVSPYLLPLFLTKFSETYPRLRLTVDELKTDDILEQLRDDAIDAGILATPLHRPGLTERPLYFEPFSLYVSRQHELNARKRIRARDLKSDDTWVLGEGHCLRHQVESFCTRPHSAGVIPNVHFEGGNIDTLRNLVRRSRGYTLVPALFVETLGAVEKRDFVREFEAPQPTRQISLVFRRDQWKAELLNALTEIIRAQVPANLRERDDKKWNILEPRAEKS